MKAHPNPGQIADEIRSLSMRVVSLGGDGVTLRSHPNTGQVADALRALSSQVTELGGAGSTLRAHPNIHQVSDALTTLQVEVTALEEDEGDLPLDIVVAEATVALSIRALSAEWTDPLVRLILDTEGADELDFSPVNGAVDVAAVAAWAGGDAALGMKMYDQSGGGQDFTATEIGNPTWDPTGIGAKPAFDSLGAFHPVENGAFNFPGGAFTDFVVAHFVVNQNVGLVRIQPGYQIGTRYNDDGDIWISIGGSTDWATTVLIEADGPRDHIIEVVVDGAGAVIILVDGVDMEATLASGDPATGTELEGAAAQLGYNNCAFAEWTRWNSALSAPDRALIRQDMADYYGITLP